MSGHIVLKPPVNVQNSAVPPPSPAEVDPAIDQRIATFNAAVAAGIKELGAAELFKVLGAALHRENERLTRDLDVLERGTEAEVEEVIARYPAARTVAVGDIRLDIELALELVDRMAAVVGGGAR